MSRKILSCVESDTLSRLDLWVRDFKWITKLFNFVYLLMLRTQLLVQRGKISVENFFLGVKIRNRWNYLFMKVKYLYVQVRVFILHWTAVCISVWNVIFIKTNLLLERVLKAPAKRNNENCLDNYFPLLASVQDVKSWKCYLFELNFPISYIPYELVKKKKTNFHSFYWLWIENK